MTGNRTTEPLNKLLSQRVIEYKTNYLHTSWRAGSKLYDAVSNFDGTYIVDNLSPEQAIAATLGSGTLTAEQVSEAIYAHSIHADCADADWQAIADELNAELGSGTCEFVDDSDGEPSPPKCNSCGYDPGIYECAWLDDGTYEYERNYCPNCGRKVVKR